ncbi:MAG: aldehyde dehydrogenase family protein, partial [Flammeovirgaceae bacterium]
YQAFVDKLVKAYSTIKIGDALSKDTLCGPLNNKQALELYENVIKRVTK